MRSFQQVIVFLFALLACAFAQSESEVYDATVYITSTVYRVNTVTLSGSPTGSVANQTSTFSASHAPTYPAISSLKANGTSLVLPTGTGARPSATPTQFTGAASSLNINAYVAVLAAGVGYLVL